MFIDSGIIRNVIRSSVSTKIYLLIAGVGDGLMIASLVDWGTEGNGDGAWYVAVMVPSLEMAIGTGFG